MTRAGGAPPELEAAAPDDEDDDVEGCPRAVAGPAGRTLSWQVEDVLRLELHPGAGSVGSLTAADGRGSIRLTPATSTEYLLVASNTAGMFIRAASVEVPGSPLPVRLDELRAALPDE